MNREALSNMFEDAMMNQFSDRNNQSEEQDINEAEPDGDGDEDGIQVKDSAGIKSGKYSKKTFQGIFRAAKVLGIDGYTAAALALQESGLGTAKVKGRRGKFAASLAQIHDFSDAQQKELDDLSAKTGIESEYLKLGIALRDKIKYGQQLGFKDEASQLQAFNGYGVLTKDKLGGADKAYGVPVGNGIDMKKNPLYGKRLIQLKNDLMANKEIGALVQNPLPKLDNNYLAQKLAP